ncbi:hypothetical protein NECAME_01816 [Necator americanus]|uniref:G protein-coupled receptor n=1 Tax=Necator americanus TaxID=51031 RepID=W2TP91_NECAM|nr:hypothetical protein NECAME_01816 [Necator americanus]ETN83509.1 hypothetical protein NECAME_01816 [Necator americanus]
MIYCELDPKPEFYITSMRVLSAITLPVDLFANELRPQYLQNYSCIASIVDIPGLQYFAREELRTLFLIGTSEAFVVVISSFTLVYLTFRNLRNANLSKKTIEMQKRFQKSLMIQVTIPLLIVIIPGCSVMSVVWMGDFRSVGSFVLVIQSKD